MTLCTSMPSTSFKTRRNPGLLQRYFGSGLVLAAAHLVGPAARTHPRVRISGLITARCRDQGRGTRARGLDAAAG
jgi:hypothetical protein